jgi:hypothetical protein
MRKARPPDVKALERGARKSQDKESFQVLAKMRNYRIGVGARLDSSGETCFFLEVLVDPCGNRSSLDLDLMEKSLMVLRELSERGYTLTCEEDGSVSCEKSTAPEKVDFEKQAVDAVVKRRF